MRSGRNAVRPLRDSITGRAEGRSPSAFYSFPLCQRGIQGDWSGGLVHSPPCVTWAAGFARLRADSARLQCWGRRRGPDLCADAEIAAPSGASRGIRRKPPLRLVGYRRKIRIVKGGSDEQQEIRPCRSGQETRRRLRVVLSWLRLLHCIDRRPGKAANSVRALQAPSTKNSHATGAGLRSELSIAKRTAG